MLKVISYVTSITKTVAMHWNWNINQLPGEKKKQNYKKVLICSTICKGRIRTELSFFLFGICAGNNFGRQQFHLNKGLLIQQRSFGHTVHVMPVCHSPQVIKKNSSDFQFQWVPSIQDNLTAGVKPEKT